MTKRDMITVKLAALLTANDALMSELRKSQNDISMKNIDAAMVHSESVRWHITMMVEHMREELGIEPVDASRN